MRLFPAIRYSVVRSAVLFGAALTVIQSVAPGAEQQGLAQSLPTCDPPRANEYLLLVMSQQPDTEEQLRQLLPENAALSNCQYLNDQVVRVGGFADAEIANAWAQYLTDMTGLQAFVARPSVSASPSTAAPTEPSITSSLPSPTPTAGSPTPAPAAPAAEPTATPAENSGAGAFPTPTQVTETPASDTTPDTSAPSSSASPSVPATAAAPVVLEPAIEAFNPRPLGTGYAVLVYYFNRPEVAADVRQLTAQPVGLVSYEQQPFLLAAYTSDAAAATAVLQTLNERGFTAILVDSRRAILLTPAVVGTGQEG
jgi:hypothetical protein